MKHIIENVVNIALAISLRKYMIAIRISMFHPLIPIHGVRASPRG